MSLRARILWLALAATLLPVLAMVLLLLQQRAMTLADARGELVARAEAIGRELDDKVAGTGQLLFGLGRVPLLDGGDKHACSAFLADVLREHPQYTGLLTIRTDGRLHCDSLHSGRTLDLRDRQYFQQALVSTGPVMEGVVGRLTGKGLVQVAYPVRDASSSLRFVMLASFDLEAYGASVRAALPYPDMGFEVWTAAGQVLMQVPLTSRPGTLAASGALRDFVLGGPGGRVATLDVGGQRRIWTVAEMPRAGETGLRLVLSVPEHSLHAGIDRRFQQALGWLLAIAVVIFLGAAVLAEFALRRQAIRMMSAISRLDAGDYATPIGAPYPRGELGDVMGALDRLAGSLHTQRGEITRYNEALERQANVDALTGLANRNLLTDRLEQALIFARRANRVAAVLVLDLDRFKTVNDSLGHTQGDVLLRETARRLVACVRQGDTVARLGGDEFVVVLSDMAGVSDAVPIASVILERLAEPLEVEGQTVSSSASIGVSAFPRDGETADTLLRHADTAMYRAKEQGGNTMTFFTPEMNLMVTRRLQIEAGLRRALDHDELRVHFQPIVDVATGRIAAAEALVRWEDPERGMVGPAEFIPVAEETGLIVAIGNRVLHEACRQARAWIDLGIEGVPVAVNLSARQFADLSLDAAVEDALRSAGCPASALQLEITESMVMHNAERALATMHRLNTLGVRLSMDDFGTGYSSLSYLKRFPVHKLKIDRSFVRDINIDANDEAIVDAILVLSKKLGVRTVAEGVETPAQLEFLRAHGCDEYQGYLFARPCPADAFVDLLLRDRAPHPQRVPLRIAP
ncbi:MAG: EAL domain-containing protein [Burkholderiales bacterium]|nr:EAL domain-containing protein [Burkholderiales bacterium]